NIIAFGGRVMDDSKPKYINSPETMVYHKSRTLFALNVAKKSTSKRYILCEGYMDVISMHEAGFDTAVCACGTALTPEQVKLLTEYADEVVLSYDSDEAGQKATERSLALFSGTNLQVRVLNIPGAKDPDEFIRTYGRDRFEAVLEGTATPLEFKLAKAVKKYDLRNDAQRLQYVDEAIGILAGSAVSPTARDVYAGRIAEQTGIDKKAVLVQLESAVRGAGRRARRKEQNELSRQGIAADIRVPYDRGGEAALGAASAARQLVAAMLQDAGAIPYIRERLNLGMVVLPEMQQAIKAIYDCAARGQPANATTLSPLLEEKAYSQVMLAQAQNADTRLTRRDIDMLLDRLQTANPESAQVAGTTDDEFRQKFAALARKKVGERPPEE
ncbi:MAG: toprim domain-containing protein, partial [Subdoligranulum sp.]|nr:toprim domain-containing protein [Subdoligranulum sp.]